MLDLYVVRNREMKWFRAKGRDGYGDTWVDEIAKARIYTKLSQARATVTFFAAKWPQFGVPQIVHLIAKTACVLNEHDRVAKSLAKKKADKERQDVWRKKAELLAAQLELSAAKKRLADLGRPAS